MTRRSTHRVWVTRDEPATGPLCTALHDQGLDPILEPVLERRLVADLSGSVGELGPDDWLVLTSMFAIDAIDSALVRCRVAVVGASSAARGLTLGLPVHLVASQASADSLWREIEHAAENGATILYPRSSQASPPSALQGLDVRSPVLYETSPRPFDSRVCERTDVVVLASPSAVRAVAHLKSYLPRCASIGPTTSRAMRELGLGLWLEAPEPTFHGLARTIGEALASARDYRPHTSPQV